MLTGFPALWLRAWPVACLAVLALLVLPGMGHAQEDKKAAREREQARRVQQAQQQAQQALKKVEEEKAAILREKAEVDAKLKDATSRIGAAEKAARALQGAAVRARRLEDDLKREKEAAAALQAKLDDGGRRIGAAGVLQTETQRTLASREAQLKQVQAALLQSRTQATAEIGVCEDKNAKLYAHGAELMRLYRDKTAFDALRQAEPVTGLKAVAIENLLEEYRDKLATQRAAPR